MTWVRWNNGLYHVTATGQRTECGVMIGPAVRASRKHPPPGAACGNCLARLAEVERFAREARGSQGGNADG